MSQAKQGDTVRVHYTGKLDNGVVFDSSAECEPLEFTIGARQVIPGFEEAIVGMNTGESKTTRIPSDQAYGEHDPDRVLFVDQAQVPDNLRPEVGQQLQVQADNGQPFTVTVAEISDAGILLDANHPLAGEDLTFELELLEIL
jgi:peptidylprolyl isomerase